jgi:ribonucleotide reductase alpha subunit
LTTENQLDDIVALDEVARTVLRERCLRRDERGTVIETPDECFRRVADAVAAAEATWGGDVDATADRFYDALSELEFLPNSPTLMNAGTEFGQLAACFVLPVEDSLASISETLKRTALIHQSGGGTGFSFSKIAPTGTISMIAGATAGIEPIYNVVYEKHVLGGLEMVNDRFVGLARERGFYDEALLADLRGRTSIQDVEDTPADVKRLSRTVHDAPPKRHVAIQAAFQRHVDNAVSKTVNLPHDAGVDDVREVVLAARRRGLKGITVFRSGARPAQVLGDDPLKQECAGECEYAGER